MHRPDLAARSAAWRARLPRVGANRAIGRREQREDAARKPGANAKIAINGSLEGPRNERPAGSLSDRTGHATEARSSLGMANGGASRAPSMGGFGWRVPGIAESDDRHRIGSSCDAGQALIWPRDRARRRYVSFRSDGAIMTVRQAFRRLARRVPNSLARLYYLPTSTGLAASFFATSEPLQTTCHLRNTRRKTRLEACDSEVFSLCVQVA
jgi:hypothetical protein